jgi:hypothetical protein
MYLLFFKVSLGNLTWQWTMTIPNLSRMLQYFLFKTSVQHGERVHFGAQLATWQSLAMLAAQLRHLKKLAASWNAARGGQH